MIFILVGIFILIVVVFFFFTFSSPTKPNTEELENKTANELVNVKDIKNTFLYRKDGYVYCYLKVLPYNVDLLSQEEKRAKTNVLASDFGSDRKAFTYFTLPREIDLDGYKQDIKNAYMEEMADLGTKRILQMMLGEATELATNGENYEHQHYIRLWKKQGSDIRDCEKELMQRAEEFVKRYQLVGIALQIANFDEIIKICNLFANPIQAVWDIVPDNNFYEPIFKNLK